MWVDEGQVTWCGWKRARSLCVGGGGPGHLVRVEEGQVTWCGWMRARSLGADGRRAGYRGNETVRPQEKEQNAARMGGLCKQGYKKESCRSKVVEWDKSWGGVTAHEPASSIS